MMSTSTQLHGQLNFLDALEQMKVQKLLESLKSHEIKEAGNQTSFQVERPVQEKSIQTEITPCACSLGLATKIEEMNKKLELFIAKETQYTLLTTPNTDKFGISNQDCEYDRSETLSPAPNLDSHELDASKLQEQPHYDREQVTAVELPRMCQIIPPPSSGLSNNIRPAIFDETYKESSSMVNYAKNLVFKLFSVTSYRAVTALE